MPASRARRAVTAVVLLAVLGLGAAIFVALRSWTGSEARSSGTEPVRPAIGSDSAESLAPEGAAAVAQDERKIVKTASLSLTVTSIEHGAAGIRQVALDLEGQVTDERVVVADPGATTGQPGSIAPPPGPTASITVSVPADRLDTALERLSALGTVAQRTATARDVTTSYVDTESRIASKKASVDRVRAMMAQTTAVSQLVELESQLAQRESELESMQRTLASLQRKVAMSTVTVTLATARDAADGGFLGGLGAGWRAFVASVALCVTVIGAMLPFVVALAVLGLPLLVWWRRRRTIRAGSTLRPDPAPAAVGSPAEPDE